MKSFKNNKLLFSSIAISLLSIFSLTTGFIRESVIAAYFGTSNSSDAYYMAISIQTTLIAPILSTFVTVFTPEYLNKKIKFGSKESEDFANKFIFTTFFIICFISISCFYLAPNLIKIFAPSFPKEKQNLTVALTRFIFLLPLINLFNTQITAILNANKKYVGTQLRGVVANAVSVALIFIFTKTMGNYVLVFSLLMSALIQLLILKRPLKDVHNLKFKFAINDKDVKATLKGVLPLIIGILLVQANSMIDRMMASGLAEGSISALSYSNLIISLLMTLSYTPIQTVLYPEIVERVSSGKNEEVKKILMKGFNIIIILLIPLIAGSMMMSHEIIRIAFMRGKFNINSVNLTANAFFYLVIGVLFNSILNFFTTVFLASKQYYIIVVTGALGVTVNIFLNLILTPRYGIQGLAIATSCGLAANCILNIALLLRMHHCINLRRMSNITLKVIIGTIVMLVIGLSIKKVIFNSCGIYLMSCIVIISSILVYAVSIRILKVEEIQRLELMLLPKIKKHLNSNKITDINN